VVLRGDTVVWERYAADFGPDQLHTIMSISKTAMNLAIGQLVEQSKIDLGEQIGAYLPEIGSGYAEATVQQVLDMNVTNDFNEDTSGRANGLYDWDAACGQRLRFPPGPEQSIRECLLAIQSDNVTNDTGETLYKSSNTEVLGWLVERQSGQPLRDWYRRLAEATGIEASMHVWTDCDFVPIASGGISLTVRDLARYGALFLRGGEGIYGQPIGSAAFLEATRTNPGTRYAHGLRYSNQTFTNGRWFGHSGAGGQWMLADPNTDAVVAFFSVLENDGKSGEGYWDDLVALGQGIVAYFE